MKPIPRWNIYRNNVGHPPENFPASFGTPGLFNPNFNAKQFNTMKNAAFSKQLNKPATTTINVSAKILQMVREKHDPNSPIFQVQKSAFQPTSSAKSSTQKIPETHESKLIQSSINSAIQHCDLKNYSENCIEIIQSAIKIFITNIIQELIKISRFRNQYTSFNQLKHKKVYLFQ